MLARISLRRKQYSEALCRADEALALHQKSSHRPGIFENLYLKAEILYASDDYEQSAGILTALIKEKAPAFTTFYPANAYTLLGLINLRQDRLNTARTLFKQAIDLENSQNRIKAPPSTTIIWRNLPCAKEAAKRPAPICNRRFPTPKCLKTKN